MFGTELDVGRGVTSEEHLPYDSPADLDVLETVVDASNREGRRPRESGNVEHSLATSNEETSVGLLGRAASIVLGGANDERLAARSIGHFGEHERRATKRARARRERH